MHFWLSTFLTLTCWNLYNILKNMLPYFRKWKAMFLYRSASNKRRGAYLFSKLWGGRLFEDGRLFGGGAYTIASIVQVNLKKKNFVTYRKSSI